MGLIFCRSANSRSTLVLISRTNSSSKRATRFTLIGILFDLIERIGSNGAVVLNVIFIGSTLLGGIEDF